MLKRIFSGQSKNKVVFANEAGTPGIARVTRDTRNVASKFGIPHVVDSATFEKYQKNSQGVKLYWLSN